MMKGFCYLLTRAAETTQYHELSYSQQNTEKDQPLLCRLSSFIFVGNVGLSSLSFNTEFSKTLVVSPA